MAITDERIKELIEGTCPKAATTGYYADLLLALRELLALRDAAQPNFTCQSCGAMFCVKVPSQLTTEQFLEGVPRCSRCVEVEQLSGELLALREQNRWIPVTEETTPKPLEPILFIYFGKVTCGYFCWGKISHGSKGGQLIGEWRMASGRVASRESVSAYRLLPAPPVEGGSRG